MTMQHGRCHWSRAVWQVSGRACSCKKDPCYFWLTWKLSPLKPRVRLKSKLNKLLGLMVQSVPSKRFSLQSSSTASKMSLCGNLAPANFRYCEISQLRIFAPTKFQQNEISLQWIRNFVWLDENSLALWRNFVAKFRRIFPRTTNEKHRISFALLLHSTVPWEVFRSSYEIRIK